VIARVAIALALVVTAAACGSDVEKGKPGNVATNAGNGQPGSSELNVGAPSGDLVEGAAPITVALSLTRAPTAPVTVTVSSSSPEVTIEPTQLTFDSATFAAQQRISVSVVDNTEVTGDRSAQLDFSLASTDATFAGKPVNPLVLTVIEDDSTPSFDVVSPTGSFEVAEDGGSLTLDVTLSIQPDGDVLVPLRLDDESEGSIDVTQMTFAELNWNIPQRVTITGIDDMEADGDTPFNLVLGPSNSTGDIYNGAGPLNVSIVSIDGVCGNGIVDGSEPCEPMPGESMSCPYGDMSCTYCTDSCTEAAGTVSGFCGDGTVQAGEEECDGPTERCAYGQMSCTTCSSSCREVAGQLTGYCGDGTVQSNQGEACDPASSACCDNNCQLDGSDCTPDCLVISHYLEGAGFNKALSIYNCGPQAESLAGVKFCLYRNADTVCSQYYSFSGTIAPGDVVTICNSQASDTNANTVCDDFESNVTQFNGDDRIALFLDLDGNDFFSPGDTVIDAFGELDRQPFFEDEWRDRGYQRCNFSTYSGSGAWDVLTYFTQVTGTQMFFLDDVPTAGCP
jgi:hypothetical protein